MLATYHGCIQHAADRAQRVFLRPGDALVVDNYRGLGKMKGCLWLWTSKKISHWTVESASEQWKKGPWLFRVYRARGWNTTQLWGDYNKPLLRIPIKQPEILVWTRGMEAAFGRIIWSTRKDRPVNSPHTWPLKHLKKNCWDLTQGVFSELQNMKFP